MEPEVRTALLAVGFIFCIFFAGLTLGAIVEGGFGPLNAISLVIVALLLVGLIGAIKNPPDD